MDPASIIAKLPYSEPFLFVDEIISIDASGVLGSYRFRADADFYRGHFTGNPVTPGVILTETMAQIGVVCLGIYLLADQLEKINVIAMTSIDIEFLKPVLPNEFVTVKSKKIYFRFGKLKCAVAMYNNAGQKVCNGTIAGIFK